MRRPLITLTTWWTHFARYIDRFEYLALEKRPRMSRHPRRPKNIPNIVGVDLFCGVAA